MTAINPARLKIQCAELAESFQQPSKFVTELHDLLSFYSARIRMTSLSKTPLTLRTYQVPGPVLKALEQELSPLADSSPDQALKLLDALWKEEWLEIRQLTVILLGYIPASHLKGILTRIQSWMEKCPTEDIRRLLMTRGLKRLAAENPNKVLNFLNNLGSSELQESRQAALLGLVPFAEDQDFDNLPMIFNNLRDILLVDETALVKEITALLRILQRRSDQETAYFLVRQLASASKPRIIRVIRQVLNRFSAESQVLLKEGLSTYK